VKTLTMNAPGKNALGTELMTWLVKEFREANGEPIFLHGNGDAFCAGLNLKEVASLDEKTIVPFMDRLEEMVDVIYNYPGPTIAWINGHAIAGGCVVALACDHRLIVNDPGTRIGLNEVQIGLQFPPKTWRLVTHRIPAHGRDRVILEGGLYGPEHALRLGLVDEIVPDEAAARHYAENVAKASLAAYAIAKRDLRRGVLAISEEEKARFIAEAVPKWCAPALKTRLATLLKK
jgi:enoyl-CoA hydratase/carnithine racemase